MTNASPAHGELSNARTRLVGSRDGRLADAIVWGVRSARASVQRARKVWEAITSVVTGLGWAVAVLILVSFVTGYGFGLLEAIVLAWSGVALALSASLYLTGRTAHELRLSLPNDRVVVGDAAGAVVAARNSGRRRLPRARVEVPVGSRTAEFAMPSLGRGESFEEAVAVPTERRGVVRVGPVRTVRADPLGLLRREMVFSQPAELYVHPRTVAIPTMSTGFIRDLEGETTRTLTASDVAFHSLREYTPGDERRNIHWKSTAKTGSFMVRQYEETKRSHLMVALSLAERDYADPSEFELAVSVAGSLGVCALRDSRTVTAVASAVTDEFAKRPVHEVRALNALSRQKLLDDLAGVERDPNALGLADLAAIAAEESASTSIAFLVCGSTVAAAQLRLASTKFAPGVTLVAVVCESEAFPATRRVGEMTVVTVGYLEDVRFELGRRSKVA